MHKRSKELAYTLSALFAGAVFGSGCVRTGDTVTTIDGFAQGSTYHIVVKSDRQRPEIQQAIDTAFDNPPDDLAAYRIRRIPCKGERPTPEEAIAYLSGQVADQK